MFETGLHILLGSVGVKAYLELHRVSLQQWLTWSHISQNDIYICICELSSTCVPNDKLHLYAKQNKGEWLDAEAEKTLTKAIQGLTFFTTLRQELLCSLGTGQSDWGVTAIWNKIHKSQKIFFFNKLTKSLQMRLQSRNEFLFKSSDTHNSCVCSETY